MFCPIDGLQVYHEIIGEGVPILTVHGFGLDHRTMKGCLEPVLLGRPEGWKRVYFDLPGMGRTEAAEWIRNSDDLLEIVLAFADAVIPGEPFLVAGESYGGYLARGIVRRRPQAVLGVLLIAPLAVADDAERDLPPRRVAETTARRDHAFLESLDSDDRAFYDLFAMQQDEVTWQRFAQEMASGFQIGDDAFKSRIRAVENYALTFDVDDLAEPFHGPSLFLVGRQDILAGYRDTWRFVENYPRSTFALLDLAGHALQIDQKDLFDALVNEWLDRVIDAQKEQTP